MQKFLRLFSCAAIVLALSISLGAFSCEENANGQENSNLTVDTNITMDYGSGQDGSGQDGSGQDGPGDSEPPSSFFSNLVITQASGTSGFVRIDTNLDSNGFINVRVLETGIGNTGQFTNDTYDLLSMPGVLQDIFSVSIDGAVAGLVVGDSLRTITNQTELSIPITTTIPGNISSVSQSIWTEGNPAKIISGFFGSPRSFSIASTSTYGMEGIGILCQAQLSEFTSSAVASIDTNPLKLTDGHTMTCGIAANVDIRAGWVADIVAGNTLMASPENYTTTELLFGGINTGTKTSNNLGNGVNIMDGVSITEMTTMTAQLPHGFIKIRVEIVSSM